MVRSHFFLTLIFPEENQKELGTLGAIPLLLPLLKSESEVVQMMSSKALHNAIDVGIKKIQ
jgi:hypothetical protein